MDDASPAGEGFLRGCLDRPGNSAADPARAAGIRVVHPRIGIVLTPKGGALGKMLLPFKLGAGGPIGSGRQGMSWIGIDDLIGALHRVMVDDRFEGGSERDGARAGFAADVCEDLGLRIASTGVGADARVRRESSPWSDGRSRCCFEGVEAIPSTLNRHCGFRFETSESRDLPSSACWMERRRQRPKSPSPPEMSDGDQPRQTACDAATGDRDGSRATRSGRGVRGLPR